MIFNKKIDRVLYLMLMADRENYDNIMQFIKNMPEGLKKQLLDKIKILEEYKKTGIKNFSFLCGECLTDNNLLYSFEVDPYYEELQMGYMECYAGVYKDVVKLTLHLGDILEKDMNFTKIYIGSLEYDITIQNVDGLFNMVNSSENEYNLYKTPVRDIVVYTKDDGKKIRNHFTMIDSLDISDELGLDNIMNNASGKVRRKKK